MSTATGVRVSRLAPNETAVLGRSAECTVVVDDPSVSREHAKIVVGDRITLVDLGSRNGSRVDGASALPHEETPLRVGSILELGSTTLVLQRAAGFSGVAAAVAPPAARERSGGPIVRDPAMARLYGLLDVIAPSPLAVLILGETGVGKEIFAEQVHKRSNRARESFVKLNCAAIPESLLEGELFGYEKGAFTGAAQAKAGLFESADGGTVMLDEIGEVPLTTQAKLLRVLESGEVLRLGSLKSRIVDVRFVSATNRDLRASIAEGRFRSDLYFRLNGVSLTLPPLRKRVLDVAPLAESFIERVSVRLKRPPPPLSDAARAALEAYTWPGNVRELRNVVERAVVMGQGGEVLPEHLMLADDGGDLPDAAPTIPPSGMHSAAAPAAPSSRSLAAPPVPTFGPEGTTQDMTPTLDTGEVSRAALKAKLEAMDRKAIVDALEKCAGNQSEAARLLGMTRRALIYRIEMYGLARPRRKG